jgi:hypothetical protein
MAAIANAALNGLVGLEVGHTAAPTGLLVLASKPRFGGWVELIFKS